MSTGRGNNMESPLLKYGAILRTARIQSGLTQREVAEYVGVSEVTIYNWESGRKTPNEEHASKLRRLFASYIQDFSFVETFSNLSKKELVNILCDIMEERQ